MTTADWTGHLARAGVDKDELKAQLPLEYVALEEGIRLERSGDGRLVGLCPFHADEDPSFAIFGEDLAVWGCFPCGITGEDIFNLLMRTRETDFPGAIRAATSLLHKMEKEGFAPSPPPEVRARTTDFTSRARTAWQLAVADDGAIRLLVQEKNLSAPVAWLKEQFFLGVEDQVTVLIPHLGLADDGTTNVVTGVKTRTSTTHPYAAGGSVLSELYGAWRDKARPDVVVCEGESDTWEMAWLLKETHDVFGLPSGAGGRNPKDTWLKRMKDRNVTLMFDADRAGRRSSRAWFISLQGIASSVKVARLEDGADALTAADAVEAVRSAVGIPPWAGAIIIGPSKVHYVRNSEKQPVVTNWVLRSERIIELEEGGSAIEGTLPAGETTVITDHDLATVSSATSWSNRHGYTWHGTAKDAQGILDLLLQDRPFLATGRGTGIAGWHHGHFVTPSRSFGPERWVYIPPPADPHLDDKISLLDGEWDPRIVEWMFALNAPSVTGPILAWIAAAPLRSTVKHFPPLFVSGSSGSGKTTLLEEVLQTFGWSANFTLTGTTAHAVATLASATNGVPIWFDEYRPGARKEAKQMLDQVLRDAWTGQATIKGGMDRSNFAKITAIPAIAPLIVSGEDMLQEQSHVERAQLVNITRAAQNPLALERLRTSKRSGFGAAYIQWLVDRHWADELIAPSISPSADRPEVGRSILRWGWALLREFTEPLIGKDMGELDLSLSTHLAEEATAQTPILEAIDWGLGEVDRQQRPIVWVDGDNLCVRVSALVKAVNDYGQITLPGGTRSVSSWLREHFEATDTRSRELRVLTLIGAASKIFEGIPAAQLTRPTF